MGEFLEGLLEELAEPLLELLWKGLKRLGKLFIGLVGIGVARALSRRKAAKELAQAQQSDAEYFDEKQV